jgi:hypothetical protein
VGHSQIVVVGSVVRDDFGPQSDVDVLVEFRGDRIPGWEFYWDIPNELSAILGGRKVDMGTFQSLSRRIARDVLAEAVEGYVESR